MSGTRTATPPAQRPTVVSAKDRLPRGGGGWGRRRWLRVLIAVAVVAAFAGAVWALGWSHLLGVQRVQVVGEHRATEQLVVLTAAVEPGTPLARVDTGAAAERVRSLVMVEDAQVQRVWPHTLRITVVERTAVAVARAGSELRLVDRYGVDFATVASRPAGLPVLDLDIGSTSQPNVETAVSVVSGLPQGVRQRVVTVEVHSPDDVRLHLRSGALVLWGDDSQQEEKAAVLQALVKHGAQRYDVRAPTAPTTSG